MDFKLELISVPVSDVDRAKAFYAERAGFTVDNDVQGGMGKPRPRDPGEGVLG
jgi:predicted enzyme related to lactoylglutathione lyase